MKRLSSQRGFTLIEVIITTALLSSALLAATTTYTAISKLEQKGTSVRAVQQSGRYVLESLLRDIRNAAVVTQTSSTDITLINSQDVGGGEEYKYNAAAEQLDRCTGTGYTSCVSVGDTTISISNVDFTYEAGNAVTAPFVVVNMTLTYNANLGAYDPSSYTYSLDTVASPRDE